MQELKEKKLSCVGAVKRISGSFLLNLKHPEQLSSLLGIHKDIMLESHVPKPKKTIILVSTLNMDKKIDANAGEQ